MQAGRSVTIAHLSRALKYLPATIGGHHRRRAIANFWLRPDRSGGGGYGLAVSRFGDDLDPVVECHTENEFWQLVVTIETTPAFLRGLEQFEGKRLANPLRTRA